jgi:hypothetical protein
MIYIQRVKPDLNVTYKGGWCQKANENTVGENGVHSSAHTAWLANIQHKEKPPKGLYVPVYLSLPNGPKDAQGLPQDDVAISCPDGTIAAAALAGTHKGLFKYPSLEAYRSDYAKNNGGATYRGWGERIGNVQVVKESAVTVSQPQRLGTYAYRLILHKEPPSAAAAIKVGNMMYKSGKLNEDAMALMFQYLQNNYQWQDQDKKIKG